MTWYAAHIVLYVKFKSGRQKRFPVWENVVLIRAKSEEEAFAKAEARGREEEGDDDHSFTWGGEPANWVFAGVRKLTLCTDRPADGVEVSYLELELASARDLRDYVAGEPVKLVLCDPFPDSEAEGNSARRPVARAQ